MNSSGELKRRQLHPEQIEYRSSSASCPGEESEVGFYFEVCWQPNSASFPGIMQLF